MQKAAAPRDFSSPRRAVFSEGGLTLEVNQDNLRALRFYEREGFEKFGEGTNPHLRFENLAAPIGARTTFPQPVTGPHSFTPASSSIRVPAQSFGFRKTTGLPCAPIFGLSVAKDTRACARECVARGNNVVDLKTEMVKRAVPDACPKISRSENCSTERFDQLNLAVRRTRRKPPSRHARARPLAHSPWRPAHRGRSRSRRQHPERDGDMVQPPDMTAMAPVLRSHLDDKHMDRPAACPMRRRPRCAPLFRRDGDNIGVAPLRTRQIDRRFETSASSTI